MTELSPEYQADLTKALESIRLATDREVDRRVAIELAKIQRSPTAPKPAPPSPAPQIILPLDNTAAMTAFYGPPGPSGESKRGWANFPPFMRLYSRAGTLLKDHDNDGRGWGDLYGLHAALRVRWDAAWAEINQRFTPDQLASFGGNVTAGIYAYRPKKGGNSYSTHAWGAAVDFNPDENRFNFRECTFPDLWFDIWERHGFLSGFRAWGHDAMHLQAAIPSLIKPDSHYGQHGLPGWIKQA